jgi:hypothetical protein
LLALSVALSAIALAEPATAGSDDGKFGIKVLGTVVDPDTDATVRAGGAVIPGAAIAIFGALAVVAALITVPVRVGGSTLDLPLPLIITVIVFALSFLYVATWVPRLKAAEEARRAQRRRRRPQHAPGESPMPSDTMEGS